MASRSMRAAVCEKPGQGIVVKDVPIPEPGEREILCRVVAASLCHSDLSKLDGLMDPVYPQIIGHEAVVEVERLGSSVKALGFEFEPGDIIGAVSWQGFCLSCHTCKTAGPQFCPQAQFKGFTIPGYFAEYSCVDAASAVLISRGNSLPRDEIITLSPMFCAGVTIWDALLKAKEGSRTLTQTVAVVGAGGLGALACKWGAALGMRIIALDVKDEQLAAVHGFSMAEETINIAKYSPTELMAEIMKLNGGLMMDAAIVAAASVPAYQTGMSILKPTGTLVAVGQPKEPIPLIGALLTHTSIKILGAKLGGAREARECLDFALRKGLQPTINPRKFRLDDLPEMVELIRAGQVSEGRMVVHF